MYLEGSDQHRGWFQSSLLVALATRGRPPFREVLTHGFLIDLEGRKMSKSLGNVIAPQDVIKESGAEIIRLWVAMTEFTEELRVSKEILTRVVDVYRKLRNTCRILVANLYDFDPATDMVPLDAAGRRRPLRAGALRRGGAADAARLRRVRLLHRLADAEHAGHRRPERVLRGRDQGPDVHARRASHERRSTQTAMYLICDGLARLLAPILPVTADDLWRHLPGHAVRVGAPRGVPDGRAARRRASCSAAWDALLAVRETVNAALEQKRKDKVIGTSLGARVVITARGPDRRAARRAPRATCRCSSSSRISTLHVGPADGAGRRAASRSRRRPA